MDPVYHETTQNPLFDPLISFPTAIEHKDSSCECKGKRCTGCDKTQCTQFFYPDRNKGKLRSRCVTCEAELNRIRSQNNKDKRSATKKIYNDSHRKEINERRREWEKENPERVRARERKRYAQVRASEKQHTLYEWLMLKKHYNNTCLCCKRNDVRLTVDHVIPLSIGGSDGIDNIQPLCLKCNAIKGQKSTDYR